MILNDFSFNKSHLEVMVNQLQKVYSKGWDKLNISVTYDCRVRLTDDGFLFTKGFMVIGKKEYQQLVDELGTEDTKRLTHEIYQRVVNHRGVRFQQELVQQLVELKEMPYTIKNGFIANTEYATVGELANHYQADKDLYIELNHKSSLKVVFRGKSVLYQGSNGSKIVYEEVLDVDDEGKVTKSLKEIILGFMEEETTKFNYDGVNAK